MQEAPFYLWTETAPLALFLGLIGLVLYFSGALLMDPIEKEFLSKGVDDLPPHEDIEPPKKAYERWAIDKYETAPKKFERTIVTVKLIGELFLAMSWWVYGSPLHVGITLVPMIMIFLGMKYIWSNRNVRETAKQRLAEWHSEELKYRTEGHRESERGADSVESDQIHILRNDIWPPGPAILGDDID